MVTSEQMKAARALLRWDQKALADASEVSVPTIKRLETQRGAIQANPPTIAALLRAFDTAGIVFLPAGADGGAGVRRRL